MPQHVVAKVGEIEPGTSKIVTVNGRDIGIFNVKGDYYALLNICPHEAAPLCRGRIVGMVVSSDPGKFEVLRQGEMLRCPWHGWQYDIRTGQSWCNPEEARVRRYNVTVEPGERIAKGPYIAERFAVSVKDDYIVVEV